MAINENDFYNKLPVYRMPLSELLNVQTLMAGVPASWHVIVTDIRGSTQAVIAGKHEQVNLIATGSIVTVLNIAFELAINIPFFFGGDGATFIVPDSMIEQVMKSLMGYRGHVMNKYGLDLRTGTVPVADIYKADHHLRIAKFGTSTRFVIPIVLGHGLSYAEQLIKSRHNGFINTGVLSQKPDLSGMQCRWDRIAPPSGEAEILTLLVSSNSLDSQARIFAEIINKIEDLYGPFDKRQPISVPELKLKSTFKQLKINRAGILKKSNWAVIFPTWFNTLYCQAYFRTSKGKAYLERLVEMSDTLVIDGRINMVISGDTSQRAELLQYLDQLELNNYIFYGSHISNASVMSCYVRDLDYGHVHFVDGAEGGYTQAARVLKSKLHFKN